MDFITPRPSRPAPGKPIVKQLTDEQWEAILLLVNTVKRALGDSHFESGYTLNINDYGPLLRDLRKAYTTITEIKE